MSDEPSEHQPVSRRYFFTILGSGALIVSGAGSMVLGIQFLSPNVLYEPPTQFPIGKAEEFSPGSVALLPKHKVFVVRAPEGFFYAMSAVCTHLGCISNWDPERKLVACPCHGSLFARDGSVIQGPAPRPLPHFRIYEGRDARLWVNSQETVSPDQVLKT